MLGRRFLSGIDIGSNSLKIVKLKRKGGEVALDWFGYTELQRGIKLPEEWHRISESINNLILLGKKVRIDKVASAISAPSLIINYLTLPEMPKRDLSEAVKWEAKKQISFPSEDLICDYVVVDKIAKNNEKHLSILSFAISRSDVQEHINILKESSLTPVALDAIPMALLSSFDHNYEWEKGANYALIDIGMTKTSLVILKDKRLRFAREIPFGGREITSQFMESPGLPKDQQIDKALLLDNELIANENSKNQEKTKANLAPLLEHLILELQRSFDYYKAQFREGEISRVFLSGGTAKLKGIDEILSENINISCFVDDPLKNIKVNYKKFKKKEIKDLSPLLTIAVGLALRRVGE